ncbi:MAG: hypothetical protein KBD78_11270 [Oligoflexales bacterium]|nr:hypothetical protein [Oligoflexales bacterium]
MKKIKNFRVQVSLFHLMLLSAILFAVSSPAWAIFFDGRGHYSLRGQTQTNPELVNGSGTHQAIEQSFLLEGEARLNDRSSFFLELGLTGQNRGQYLGDTAQPYECTERRIPGSTTETETECAGRTQDQSIPGYKPYDPQIRAAYARYAFDYCILEVGRRPRHWGLGVLVDRGDKPFNAAGSYYDGATCEVNLQQSQAIGFSIGYDKLQESGEAYDNPFDRAESDTAEETRFLNSRKYGGAASKGDDMDQFFFTLELDDRKEKSANSMSKIVGIYFANLISATAEDHSSSDVKYLDLYTGLFFSSFAWKNEIVFRMGKSNAPLWVEYGGRKFAEDQIVKNDLNAIGIAGNLDWTLSSSGSIDGPAEFRQGSHERHALQFDYAIAPGDKDSYAREFVGSELNVDELKEDSKVGALPFHPNYKPALIFFNGHKASDELNDSPGAFNNHRFVNASLLALSYRYESFRYGVFSAKFIKASLLEGMTNDVRAAYDANPSYEKPIGYKGKNIGFELDLEYTYFFGREVELGGALALAVPGNAWDRGEGSTTNSFLIQSHVAFHF